jgi:hypothetical protein
MHTESGKPVKSALRPQPARLIARVFVAPMHDDALVSVTTILPLAVPKLTVILFVPDPAVILDPVGTVHA